MTVSQSAIEVLAGPGGHGVVEILERLREKGVPVRWLAGGPLWVAGREVHDGDKPLHDVLVRMFDAQDAVHAAALARVDGRERRNRVRRCPACGAQKR